VGRKVSETVDFDKSAQESRTVILPGIDEQLDQMKRTLNGLESLLDQVAIQLAASMPPDSSSSLNVIYFPQIGFLVTIPLDHTTQAPVYEGDLENPWERLFSTEYARAQTLSSDFSNRDQGSSLLQNERDARNG
jgi:DNA mismatch repair protein MSH5